MNNEENFKSIYSEVSKDYDQSIISYKVSKIQMSQALYPSMIENKNSTISISPHMKENYKLQKKQDNRIEIEDKQFQEEKKEELLLDNNQTKKNLLLGQQIEKMKNLVLKKRNDYSFLIKLYQMLMMNNTGLNSDFLCFMVIKLTYVIKTEALEKINQPS